MSYADTMSAMAAKRLQITALRKELRELQSAVEPQVVQDYELAGWDGPVKLSQLFGDKNELFVIHNMGTGCVYCTLWADGFNGVYDHMADRAAFVLTSPNPPETQKQFAKSRGWRFPMASHQGSDFAKDMGFWRRYEDPNDERLGGWHPGVSVFRKEGDRIVRVSDTDLGPGDDFCAVWHFLDLLPEGSAGWSPKYRYA